ncbi:MAG: type IV pilus assembly protein PilM [Gaiellaceae bacterium]
MGDESIWKKEISFGRKREPKEEKADETASVWKKEISFGRKKKSAPEPVAEEPVVDEPGVEAEEEPAQTWTRAVSFGRKPAPVDSGPAPGTVPETRPEEPVAEDAAVASEEPTETWTRAVSFGRKPDAEPEAVDSEPAEGTVPETRLEEPVAEEAAVASEAEPVTVDSGPAAGTAPETGPEETAETWTRAVSFGRKPDAEPEAVDSGHAEGTVPETGPDQPAAEESAAPADDATETWTRAVSFGRSPDAEPEAVAIPAPAPGVHAPVTAEELPPLADEETKSVPFWKKDLSFGGGKTKEKKPKAERAPKPTKEKKQKAPKEPKERKPKQPKAAKVKAERGSRGAKRITGLKIGASQLAAARVANNGSAELLQIARTPLDPGIVVGGELRDPDALAEALKAFFAANDLPKKGVRLGIANNRIGVRTFEIAGVTDEKQLANAIRFRAQEALPIPIDEAVLDFQVLGEGTDDAGQPTKRVLLVVAYRELIDRYMNACKQAGISLVGIDLEAFALLRALQPPQDGVGGDSAAALVAVAIGHDRSTFAVSDGRICEFTRVLEWGGSALNVAIARALDAAPSEVDGVKRALALTDEMVPEGLTDDQAKKARDAMRRAIQTFARELVSSLQYYQNQPGSLGIGEIVLTGGTAHLSGLAGELERLIGVRVRVGDPLARMKVSKKVGEAEQVGSLAVAIGLGIED